MVQDRDMFRLLQFHIFYIQLGFVEFYKVSVLCIRTCKLQQLCWWSGKHGSL